MITAALITRCVCFLPLSLQAHIRTLLTESAGVRAVTQLEVHAESATSSALHVHARVALDGGMVLRDALSVIRRVRSSVQDFECPLYYDPSAVASGSMTVPAKAAAHEVVAEGGKGKGKVDAAASGGKVPVSSAAGSALLRELKAHALGKGAKSSRWHVSQADVEIEAKPV